MGDHLRLFSAKMKKKYIIFIKILYNSCVYRNFFVLLHAENVQSDTNVDTN